MKIRNLLLIVTTVLFVGIGTLYGVSDSVVSELSKRYRDLETGTFLTPDPLGFVDGPNRYTYVTQNPWTKFDPLGLNRMDPNSGKYRAHQAANAAWKASGGYVGAAKRAGSYAVDSAVSNFSEPAGLISGGVKGEFGDSVTMNASAVGVGVIALGAGTVETALDIASGGASKPGKQMLRQGAKELGENLVETSIEQSAKDVAQGGADFIVTPKGTAVPTSQSQMREGFENAEFPSKPTASPGTAYTMPDGNQVRLMEPSGQARRRASFTGPEPHDTARTPDFEAPSQPPAGATKAERKQHIRDETHVEQTE